MCTTAIAYRIKDRGVGECYIIIRGLQNCYITLYEGGAVKKINIFALYNIWTAPNVPYCYRLCNVIGCAVFLRQSSPFRPIRYYENAITSHTAHTFSCGIENNLSVLGYMF